MPIKNEADLKKIFWVGPFIQIYALSFDYAYSFSVIDSDKIDARS